ncbi:transcription factor Sp1-like isoform X2 [Pecten maximus]|uniref:transcription factor Sp1-like isoform X2 n=1 Tax=Pecten maximus TaxID=6579 RepID=UPI001458A33A|nr:transcription factor Sp1-like isoform X2 [Pecten maximus]
MTAEVRRQRKLSEAEEDYLTCGRCLCEFPLQRITTFIEHKKQECDGPVTEVLNSNKEFGLQCVSCPKAFMTAMGMLKHVQISHNLRLFLEKGAFAKGIQSTSYPNSLPPLLTSTLVQQVPQEKRTSPNRITETTVSSSCDQDKESRCHPVDNTPGPDKTNMLSLSGVNTTNQRVTSAWNNSPNNSVFHSPKTQTNQSLKTSGNKNSHSDLTQSPNTAMNQLRKQAQLQSQSTGMNQSQKSSPPQMQSPGMNQSLKSSPPRMKSPGINQSQKSSPPQMQPPGMNQSQKSFPPQMQSPGMNQSQKSSPPRMQSPGMNQSQKSSPPQMKSPGMNQSQKSSPPQMQRSCMNQSQTSAASETKLPGMNQLKKLTPPQMQPSCTKQAPKSAQQSHSSISVISQNTDSRQSMTKQPILFPVTSPSSATLPKINIPVKLLNSDGSTPSDTSVLVGQDVGVGKVVPIVLLSGKMVDMATKGCTPAQCTQVPNITSKAAVSTHNTSVSSFTSQSKVPSQSTHIGPQISNFGTHVPNPNIPVSISSKQKPRLQSTGLVFTKSTEMMELSSDTPQENQSINGRDVLKADVDTSGGSLTVPMTESLNDDVILIDPSNHKDPSLQLSTPDSVQQGHGDDSAQSQKHDMDTASPDNRTVIDSCSVTDKSLKREVVQKSDDEACCGRQYCGVTVIPGTHENTRKCCSSVLPKKRKRHMETKHMSYSWSRYNRRRLYGGLDKGRSAGTIYIDVEDVRDDPPRSQTRTYSQGDLQVSREGKSDTCMTSRGSVILQPGATFSIPLPYSTVSSGRSPRTSIIPISGAERRPPSEFPLPTDSPSQSLSQDQKSPPDIPGEIDQSGNFSEMSNSDTGSENNLDPNCSYYQGRKRRYPTSRPFKCDQCDNAFNQRIHLKKHMSKHTGEKPFKCTYCEYATAQNSTLKIHLKRHHGSQLLECPTCAKSFTHYDMYQVHQKEHQGDSFTDSSHGVIGEDGQDGGPGDINVQTGLEIGSPKHEVTDLSDTEAINIVSREQVELQDQNYDH